MKLFLVLTVLIGLTFVAKTASASGALKCETQYGGGQICVPTGNVQVTKQVCAPEKNDCTKDENFVDNLGPNYHLFSGREKVNFKIVVKNVSNGKLDKITVTDTLPNQLENPSTSLTYEVDNLNPNDTNTVNLTAQVISADQIPSDTCITNNVSVQSGNDSDSASSQICLTKKLVTVPTTPPTGPENWLILLGASVFFSATGMYFLKTSR